MAMATITTLTSRQFLRNPTFAQRAAVTGPVFITERGRVVIVLLSIEEHRRLSAGGGDTIDRLGLPPGVEAVEIEFPGSAERPRPAGFT
jgi:hypothetical protein